MEEIQAQPRRFRKRIIVATFLWLFSAFYFLGTAIYVVLVIWKNVELRWYHPDPALLEIINERTLSPPAIASVSLCPVCAFAAALAARSFTKGQWQLAIRRSILLIALVLLAAYLMPRD